MPVSNRLLPVPLGDLLVIEIPQITETPHQLTAVIHQTVSRADIQKVMGPVLRELIATIASQGVAQDGPWFTHHLKISPDVFDFEISVPVKTRVAAAGRMKPGHWPAMRVVRTVYHGPYEGLPAAWGEFDAWIAARGITPAMDLWERYLVGPESTPDPAQWRTEFNRPLAV